MTEFRENARYAIPDPMDPTRWRDLAASDGDADAELDIVDAREATKVYRVLVPSGEYFHGDEFALFRRETSSMDSSWTRGGELPKREVGIVHRVGVSIAPYVCDQRTADEDVAKVLANAHLSIEVNQEAFLAGSLETFPIGFGVVGAAPTNGLPAADAVPERYPLLYTNPSMTWEGKLSFPHRDWLHDDRDEDDRRRRRRRRDDDDRDDEDRDTDRECRDDDDRAERRRRRRREPCVRLSTDVLVTFYLAGVFGRVRDEG